MIKPYYSLNWQVSWLNVFKLMFLLSLITLLAGCPAQSTKSSNYDFDESKGSRYYLLQAEQYSGNEQTNWQLLAIRSLIVEGDLSQADSLLQQLSSRINNQQQAEKTLLQGELSIKRNRSFDLSSVSFANLTDNQKIRYLNINIANSALKRDLNGQIRGYIDLEKYGTERQRNTTINETWSFLTSLDESAISSILVYANEPILQGWIDLLYTYRNNTGIYPIEESDDPEVINQKEEAEFTRLKNVVDEWQMQYSTHPAALYLPRNIYGEKYRLPDDAHKKSVALFLPLTGSSAVFGDAIHLGYIDTLKFYPQELEQNVYLFDTNSNRLDVLVQQAKLKGVELIIGPLLKEDVMAITELAPSIPVLALNKTDRPDVYQAGATICYFPLSPEDEAKDAAQHIMGQRKHTPLIIVARNDLGQRVVNSFVEQWQQSDRSANVYVQYFDSAKGLSEKINKGVGIELEGELISNNLYIPENIPENDSNSLSTLLTSFTDNSDSDTADLPTEVRFDAIYVFASHDELAMIKSMLEMKSNRTEIDSNGKENPVNKLIPTIYASSRSNTADTTQDFRYDMDRVQFSEIPLIVNQSQWIEQLPNYIKDDFSLVRLYALGVDARRLANRFDTLKPYQVNILNGLTGQLSVGRQCEISRTLTWQQYRNGKEVAIR